MAITFLEVTNLSLSSSKDIVLASVLDTALNDAVRGRSMTRFADFLSRFDHDYSSSTGLRFYSPRT